MAGRSQLRRLSNVKSGLMGRKRGVLLLLLCLAVQANAQDESEANFLDMLEFIGEFGDEDGEWSELELELEAVDAEGNPVDPESSNVNDARPARPQTTRPAQNGGAGADRATDTATEAP